MIATLLAVLLLQPDRAAAAIHDEDGVILVWEAGDGGWRPIHACSRGAPEPDLLAWVGDTLFIACPRESLARWAPGDPSARPIARGALARRRPSRLAGGSALFFSEGRELWRYRPETDRLELLGRLPESPIGRLVEVDGGLLVAGRRTWLWREGAFESYPDGAR